MRRLIFVLIFLVGTATSVMAGGPMTLTTEGTSTRSGLPKKVWFSPTRPE